MNFKGVDRATWVRIIVLFLMLSNLVSVSLFNFQLIPFSDEEVYETVSTVLTVLVTFWTAWSNNSFTKEAQRADKYLEGLKKGDL